MITYKNRPPRGWYGFVYVLKCGDQYKIGHSITPRKRFRQLRTGSPYPLEIVFCRRTVHYKNVEKAFHYYFRDKRRSGEWFELDEDDLAYIQSTDTAGKSPLDIAQSSAYEKVWLATGDRAKAGEAMRFCGCL